MYRQIPDEDKLNFRNRLLPILASSVSQVRSQLVPILQKILQSDFPAKWPNFMDITLRLLNTNDANSVLAGLHCMLAICRVYRFKSGDHRDDFNQIVQMAFPQMLAIGTRLVDETSLDAWEMLHIVMKAYKHAIYVRPDRLFLRHAVNSPFLVRTLSPPDDPRQHGRLVHFIYYDCWERCPIYCT